MNNKIKVKVIGVGGIGCYIVEPLARYLSNKKNVNVSMTLIDGDSYEEKNRERQQFNSLRNKATETVERLQYSFPNIVMDSVESYVTEDNIIEIIREDDVVMLCVDNHATRNIVSKRCEKLKNVTLISGGNDYTDGNVIVFIRKNGVNVTKPLTELYDSIKNYKDENPANQSKKSSDGCQAQVESSPQLLFMNLSIASTMLNVYLRCEKGDVDFEQVYVDINTLRSRPDPECVFEIT